MENVDVVQTKKRALISQNGGLWQSLGNLYFDFFVGTYKESYVQKANLTNIWLQTIPSDSLEESTADTCTDCS